MTTRELIEDARKVANAAVHPVLMRSWIRELCSALESCESQLAEQGKRLEAAEAVCESVYCAGVAWRAMPELRELMFAWRTLRKDTP